MGCPAWCTSEHGVQTGEEDWVHLGAPLLIADGVSARLCMSCDPVTHVQDGPLVLIGDREYSADEAHVLGISLTELADRGLTPPTPC
jgi:hypothetical protein